MFFRLSATFSGLDSRSDLRGVVSEKSCRIDTAIGADGDRRLLEVEAHDEVLVGSVWLGGGGIWLRGMFVGWTKELGGFKLFS